jgi:hypothetical protein
MKKTINAKNVSITTLDDGTMQITYETAFDDQQELEEAILKAEHPELTSWMEFANKKIQDEPNDAYLQAYCLGVLDLGMELLTKYVKESAHPHTEDDEKYLPSIFDQRKGSPMYGKINTIRLDK